MKRIRPRRKLEGVRFLSEVDVRLLRLLSLVYRTGVNILQVQPLEAVIDVDVARRLRRPELLLPRGLPEALADELVHGNVLERLQRSQNRLLNEILVVAPRLDFVLQLEELDFLLPRDLLPRVALVLRAHRVDVHRRRGHCLDGVSHVLNRLHTDLSAHVILPGLHEPGPLLLRVQAVLRVVRLLLLLVLDRVVVRGLDDRFVLILDEVERIDPVRNIELVELDPEARVPGAVLLVPLILVRGLRDVVQVRISHDVGGAHELRLLEQLSPHHAAPAHQLILRAVVFVELARIVLVHRPVMGIDLGVRRVAVRI